MRKKLINGFILLSFPPYVILLMPTGPLLGPAYFVCCKIILSVFKAVKKHQVPTKFESQRRVCIM